VLDGVLEAVRKPGPVTLPRQLSGAHRQFGALLRNRAGCEHLVEATLAEEHAQTQANG
jgi:hypothetical protein